MKVGYLLHGIGWSGAGGSILLHLKSLQYSNIINIIYTNTESGFNIKKTYLKYSSKYRIIDLPRINNHQAGGKTNLKDFYRIINGNYSDFIERIKKDDIDILHVNSTVFSYLLKHIKDNTNIKVVVHVREMLPEYDNGEVKRYIANNISNYADKIICISDNEAGLFPKLSKIHIIPNPFDFNGVVNNTTKNISIDFQFDPNKTYVAMSGTFSSLKGHVLFLQAVNYLKTAFKIQNEMHFLVFGVNKLNPFWKLLIKRLLGKSDYGYQYQKYLKKNKLEQLVTTFTMLHTEDFYYLLKKTDIYVRPSLAGDPWGRDIIEAMAFGKPIVATGNSEFYVVNKENGFLVTTGNFIELAQKIYTLHKNRKIAKEIGVKNINKIRSLCDIVEYKKSILNLYNDLM